MNDLTYAILYSTVVLALFGVAGTFLWLANKQK